MRLRSLGAVAVLAGLLVSIPAQAHFHLDSPRDWLVTDDTGNPQKTGPCGSTTGTQARILTKVRAGSKLKIRWTETITHPGHFRISFAKDRSDLIDPVPVVTDNDCKSAPIQSPPILPVLADGVAPHVTSQDTYEQEITVPTEPCDKCTIQVIQFMSDHPPPCLYYHCADVKIVTDLVGGPVEESTSSSGGDPDAITSTSSSGDHPSSSGATDPSAQSTSGGCTIGRHAWSFGPVGIVAALGVALLRRKRRAI